VIISVRVKPRSKKTGVEFSNDGSLVLKINEPPVDGKANKAVVETIAELYGIAKSTVRIISGETSRSKRVEIPDDAQVKKQHG